MTMRVSLIEPSSDNLLICICFLKHSTSVKISQLTNSQRKIRATRIWKPTLKISINHLHRMMTINRRKMLQKCLPKNVLTSWFQVRRYHSMISNSSRLLEEDPSAKCIWLERRMTVFHMRWRFWERISSSRRTFSSRPKVSVKNSWSLIKNNFFAI